MSTTPTHAVPPPRRYLFARDLPQVVGLVRVAEEPPEDTPTGAPEQQRRRIEARSPDDCSHDENKRYSNWEHDVNVHEMRPDIDPVLGSEVPIAEVHEDALRQPRQFADVGVWKGLTHPGARADPTPLYRKKLPFGGVRIR